MCLQVVERYSGCRCLNYKHALEACGDNGKHGHVIDEKTVLTASSCPEHRGTPRGKEKDNSGNQSLAEDKSKMVEPTDALPFTDSGKRPPTDKKELTDPGTTSTTTSAGREATKSKLGTMSPATTPIAPIARDVEVNSEKAPSSALPPPEPPPKDDQQSTNTSTVPGGNILTSTGAASEKANADSSNKNELLDTLANEISNLHMECIVDKSSLETAEGVCPINAQKAAGQSQSESQSQPRPQPHPLTKKDPTKKRQRQRGKKLDDDGDSSSDSDSDSNGPRRKKFDSSSKVRRRLRCPFYLQNPRKFSTMQACSSGMGFEDVSRLKFHLKRVHTQPLRCPCCQAEMATKVQLKQHLRDRERCEVLPEPEDDRISQEKWELIDSLKGMSSTRVSVEEKYRRLYKVIFGEDEVLPSPYERSFIMPELENELASAMDEVFSKELALLPQIKEQIPSIMQACKDRLNGSTPDLNIVRSRISPVKPHAPDLQKLAAELPSVQPKTTPQLLADADSSDTSSSKAATSPSSTTPTSHPSDHDHTNTLYDFDPAYPHSHSQSQSHHDPLSLHKPFVEYSYDGPPPPLFPHITSPDLKHDLHAPYPHPDLPELNALGDWYPSISNHPPQPNVFDDAWADSFERFDEQEWDGFLNS